MRDFKAFNFVKFQFPTGWNSTIHGSGWIWPPMVSIPNGMEFYKRAFTGLGALKSFNSQRDGILRSKKRLRRRELGVSIPNGMEFYRYAIQICISKLKSFNSQRDGILLIFLIVSIRIGLVSIPNGMEFYATEIGCGIQQIPFQFPTRWNSTKNKKSLHLLHRVSIPNGMEFY